MDSGRGQKRPCESHEATARRLVHVMGHLPWSHVQDTGARVDATEEVARACWTHACAAKLAWKEETRQTGLTEAA